MNQMNSLTNSQLEKESGAKEPRLDKQKICWSDCFLPIAVLSAKHDEVILEPNKKLKATILDFEKQCKYIRTCQPSA